MKYSGKLIVLFLGLTISFSIIGCNKQNKPNEGIEEANSFYDDPTLLNQLSFYSGVNITGSGEIMPSMSICGEYVSYKNNESFSYTFNNFVETNFIGEESYVCYYVTNEIYDEILNVSLSPHPETLANARGIYIFANLYKQQIKDKNIDFLTNAIKTLKINIHETSISQNLSNYCFLDIVRFYNETTYTNLKGVDFPRYTKDNQIIHPVYDEQKDVQCFWSSKYYLEEKNNNDKGFVSLDVIDYSGLRVEKDNNYKIVKETIWYNLVAIERYPDYYDELNACIISKIFLEKTTNIETYDAVFDFLKIVKMFCSEGN